MILILFGIMVVVLMETFNRIASVLGIRQGIERILASFTLFWAWVILVSWGLSLLHLLTPEAFGVIVLALVGLTALLVPVSDRWLITQIGLFFRNALNFGRSHWIYGVLMSVGLGWCIWAVYHILLAPPATFDSLSYHMPMIANWLQHGQICAYETTTLRQIGSPINGEILQMFHVLFLRRDVIVDAVQLECLIVSCLGVYVIARNAGLSQGWALNASLAFLTAPLILIQSYTTQNDLIVVSGLALSLVWISSYVVTTTPKILILLGITIGIVLGIKLHMLIAVPVLLITLAIVFLFLQGRGFKARHVGIFLMSFIPSAFILGSGIYLRNVQNFNSLVPPIGPQDTHFVIGISTLLDNIHYFGKLLFVSSLDYVSDQSWNQDTGHYGPFFGYILLPLTFLGMIVLVIRIIKRQAEYKNFLILFSIFLVVIGTFIGFAFAHRPRPYDLRYMLFMPIILAIVSMWFLQLFGSKLMNVFAGLLCIIAIPTTIATALMHNYPKLNDLLNLDPWERTAAHLPDHGVDSKLFEMFDYLAKPGETVLFSGVEDDWSYPLFGNEFNRRVLYAKSYESFVSYLKNYHINWIIVRDYDLNQNIMNLIRSKPALYVPLITTKDTTGNYFWTTLNLYRVEPPHRNPTWYHGIYGDNLTQKEFILGSDTPGKFIIHCYVDPIFNDSLKMTISAPGEIQWIMPLDSSGHRDIELQLKESGEIKCSLSQTYSPSKIHQNPDTRELGLSILSIEFIYDYHPSALLQVDVYP